MKFRPIALALALTFTVSLAGCSGGPTGGEASPSPSESPVTTQSAQPSESAAPSPETATPTPDEATPASGEATPSSVPDKGTPPPSADPTKSPATQAPTAKPTSAATPTPTAAPTPTPTPEPTPTPAPTLTASQVFDDVYAAISDVIPAGMEPGAAVLENLYGLSADDLEDFYFRMPKTSATVTEFFVAKVKSGKMDAVKSACLDRQSELADGAAQYPENGKLVDDYRLTTNGDWLLFCITEKADQAVEAFTNSTN